MQDNKPPLDIIDENLIQMRLYKYEYVDPHEKTFKGGITITYAIATLAKIPILLLIS
jgi:hypothetical protein